MRDAPVDVASNDVTDKRLFMILVGDDHARVVYERTDALEPVRFSSTRSTDVRVDVPTRSLPSGQYLLSFEATVEKTTAKREVRFSVR